MVYNGDTLPADYDYLTPGDLRQQIQSRTPARSRPYFVYKTPEGETHVVQAAIRHPADGS